MIKAVIFDLNGVFIQSRRLSDRFYEKFGVKQEDFVPVLKEVMARVYLPGAGDTFEYWKPYLEKWGVTLGREEFLDFWFSGEAEIPEMIELARQLKAEGTKIFILSNNFSERTHFYDERFPFLKEIADKVYYSWQTRFLKPSQEAYRQILDENSLVPSECVYFDDSRENVESARELGIQAHIFKGIESFKAELKTEPVEQKEPKTPRMAQS